jgi:hypothetical protein
MHILSSHVDRNYSDCNVPRDGCALIAVLRSLDRVKRRFVLKPPNEGFQFEIYFIGCFNLLA